MTATATVTVGATGPATAPWLALVRRWRMAWLMALVLFGSVQVAAAAGGRDVVAGFVATLAAVTEAPVADFQGRFVRLAPEVGNAFDLPLMARISVGRYWEEMAPDRQTRLVEAFSRLTIATYAARFNGQSRVQFAVLGEVPGRRGGSIVQTAIVRGNGERVPIDYVMQQGPGGWRVVDIYLKGSISELATRRAEYTSLMAREGFTALVQAMERRAAELGAGAAADD